jgi:hypothetical protein
MLLGADILLGEPVMPGVARRCYQALSAMTSPFLKGLFCNGLMFEISYINRLVFEINGILRK